MGKALGANKKERSSKQRDMTTCVCSRLYRSPEVILLDKNYN